MALTWALVGGAAVAAVVAAIGAFLWNGTDVPLDAGDGRAIDGTGRPQLPGAVVDVPAWLGEQPPPPFDPASVFEAVPNDDNAAPLYLEALFQFGPEVATCFPENDARLAVAADRKHRIRELFSVLKVNPGAVDRDRRDALLDELAHGFAKVAQAQQQSRCVFHTGLSLSSDLAHGQPARNVARAAALRVQRWLEDGDVDGAIADVELVLRLSRDLRPGGSMIMQLVSLSIDTTAVETMVRPILLSSQVTVENCDRLLRILEEHDHAAGDPWLTGMRMRYVIMRGTLEAIEHGTGDFASGSPGRQLEQYARAAGMGVTARDIDRMIANMNADDFRREVEVTGRLYGAAQEVRDMSYSERKARWQSVSTVVADAQPKIVPMLVPQYANFDEAVTRTEANFNGHVCLVALRRWQLDGGADSPHSLNAVVEAAELPSVPEDPYGTGPLKFTLVGRRPTIYSIGSDGRDDGGRRDWLKGRNPGDYRFDLAP